MKKTFNYLFNSPEEKLLASIIIQSIEDVNRLPNVTSDVEFEKLRNDLWTFFASDWFFEILGILDISPALNLWDKLRKRVWNCKTHKPPYIRPERRKKKDDEII